MRALLLLVLLPAAAAHAQTPAASDPRPAIETMSSAAPDRLSETDAASTACDGAGGEGRGLDLDCAAAPDVAPAPARIDYVNEPVVLQPIEAGPPPRRLTRPRRSP